MRWILALLIAAPALAAAPEYKPFSIPWGTGPGALTRDASDARREFSGPASLRLAASGDVLIADTLAHRVLRFGPDGRPLGAVTVPAHTEHDAERSIVDVVDAGGELHMLDLADRALLRDGKPALKLPLEPSAIPSAVGLDGQHLTVFDLAENRVVRIARDGAPAGGFAHDLVQGLTPDGAGKWLGMELASPENCRGFKIWRVDPASGAKQAVADVALPDPLVEAHLLGADAAGRVYVEVAHGAVEKPTDRKVLVLKGGEVAARLPVPPSPVEWRMLSSRAVLPGGGVLTASAGAAGLEVKAHLLDR
jgi:hypothetical protein